MSTRWCGAAKLDLKFDEAAMAFRVVIRHGVARPFVTSVSFPLIGCHVEHPISLDVAADAAVRNAVKHGADVCAGFSVTSCGVPNIWRRRYQEGK